MSRYLKFCRSRSSIERKPDRSTAAVRVVVEATSMPDKQICRL
jgi:hypothetical protein